MSAFPQLPTRYEFTGEKFSGGQGDVYICTDKNLGRRVAIKFVQDINDLPRLRDEVSALQRLRSKHVVEIFDLLLGGGKSVGLVEEYVPGEDLFSSVGTYGPISITGRLIALLYQLAAGLADIHGEGVIHRDIKPNNVKLTPNNILKIFDFGLAKFSGPAAATIGFKGTYGFAAPELFGYSVVKIEPAVDVYAFGATAWYLATGTLPQELMKFPPAPYASSFAAVRPDFPKELADLLDLSLSSASYARPDMATLRDALARNLLYDRHQGLLVFEDKHWILSKSNRVVELTLAGAKAKITYDGFQFALVPLQGDIFINNAPVLTVTELPGASVVTFGGPSMGYYRKFVRLDISHPEVLI